MLEFGDSEGFFMRSWNREEQGEHILECSLQDASAGILAVVRPEIYCWHFRLLSELHNGEVGQELIST